MSNQDTTHLPTDNRLKAFCVEPEKARAAVIVIHEVWGLTSHIEAVCKRLTALQIAAIAPNLYGYDSNLFTTENIKEAISYVWSLPLSERYHADKVIPLLTRKHASPEAFRLIGRLYSKKFRAQMLAQLLQWTKYTHSKYHKVAVIGFSLGGGLSFKLAANYPKLRSCASFCGEPPTHRELRRIKIPMLAICAGHDDFMNSNIPNFIHETLRQRKNLTVKIYGDAGHEFFNNTNKLDYDARTADDSWSIFKNFLNTTLQ